MIIKLTWDLEPLFYNKITDFAGEYLCFLKNPPKTASEVPKYIVYGYHILGKCSLFYLTALAYMLHLGRKFTGKNLLPEI